MPGKRFTELSGVRSSAARRPAERRRMLLSGGLVRMYSLGVLIVGDSGIGKSESALELVARGHRFISDDTVVVRRLGGGRLTGSPPELGRYFMEVRGLGIINIKAIFGRKAILERSSIDLIIALRQLYKGQSSDRLGLKAPQTRTILGVRLPQIGLPVAPGRNIATLIEVACQVHLLRRRGYHAPREIVGRLHRVLAEGRRPRAGRHV
jgi:HPr kinase/phosphorylase